MTWTSIRDSEAAAQLLPAWFGSRMVGLRGKFGLLLTTVDVLKITSIAALHHPTCGVILLDVLLDHAGIPDAVDLAWQPKHYLGAPVPGATMATINLAQVVGAVEFTAEAPAEQPDDDVTRADAGIQPVSGQLGTLSETIERANGECPANGGMTTRTVRSAGSMAGWGNADAMGVAVDYDRR